MRVALVHDDLVQWGGAERVLDAICEVFPEAPIFTAVFDNNNKILLEKFGNKDITTSFMQKIPFWKTFYKAFLPLYPIAFEQFDFTGYDVVITHTTRFAKSILTKPETLHICYCHTPPRFLWNFSNDSFPKFLSPFLSYLRFYDQISARRVDYWISGSKNCQRRIKKIYNKSSRVLLPFVDETRFQDVEPYEGGYYLIIARLNSYKKVDVAIGGFNETGKKLVVVGTGPQLELLQKMALSNITFLNSLSEVALVRTIAGCKALIVISEEDFGLTPLEAHILGKPVIAYSQGGVLETVIEGITGVFFNKQSKGSMNEAILRFEKMKISSLSCIQQAKKFSKKRFKRQLLRIVSDHVNSV